jgi:hypothetical protein
MEWPPSAQRRAVHSMVSRPSARLAWSAISDVACIPGVLLGEGFAAGHQLETLAGAGLLAGLLAWQVRRSASQVPAARAVAGAVALAACLAAGALTVSWYLAAVPA